MGEHDPTSGPAFMLATLPNPKTMSEVNSLSPAMLAAPGRACLTVVLGRALGRVQALDQLPLVIGRAGDAGMVLDDVGISRFHARLERRGEELVVIDLQSTNGVFVNGERCAERVLRDGDRVQLGSTTVLKLRHQDPLEEEAQRRLYESATRDPLTGTFNRRYLLETLESELAYCRRHQAPLSVLAIDLDHFKSINDRFGHPGGDHALRETTAVIQDELRNEDLLARAGGEEFVVVLRYASGNDALQIAERIRRSIAARPLAFDGQPFGVTISIGVVTLDVERGLDVDGLLAAADGALYQAKRDGRDRVVVV